MVYTAGGHKEPHQTERLTLSLFRFCVSVGGAVAQVSGISTCVVWGCT